MRTIKGFDIKELNLRDKTELSKKRLIDSVSIRFALDNKKAKKLKRAAFELNTSISEIVGCAIIQFIDQFDPKNAEFLTFKKDDKVLY